MMRILIVDDSKAMRMIVRRSLRQAEIGDHEVHEASNGLEGLAAVDEFNPTLILSDWNMPEMNGIDFLRALREQGDQTRFGFVTSEGTPEMRRIAAEAGAEFLIAKPFDGESFHRALGMTV